MSNLQTKLTVAIVGMIFSVSAFAQRPPRPQGPPERMGMPRDQRPNDDRRRDGNWIDPHDTNGNGKLEPEEFQKAVEMTYADLDRDKNGTIEANEVKVQPRPIPGQRPGQDRKPFLPPFFFAKELNERGSLTKAEFEKLVGTVFREMDKDGDGSLGRNEARRPGEIDAPRPRNAPNGKFIAAELRFGDKLIKDHPFSAEILIEDTRRLFDGSTVTKQIRGATYRDGEGRTRREQPLEMVGGVSLLGNDNKPQMLVFINDFPAGSQIFLDLGNRVARKSDLGTGQGPLEPGQPDGAKTESLGTKLIEGVSTEGTRVTFEIPVGRVGNDKPIHVVSERWFSPELQVLVMSKDLDPIAGEHVFKLVNIRRAEPASELFAIPTGFKIENRPGRKRNE